MAGGAAIVLCGLAGELGRFHWTLDLFSHFRLQYSAVLLGLVLAFSAFRWWKTTTAVLATLMWQIWPVALYWMPTDSGSASEGLRVLSFNVHADNQRKPEVIDAIRRSNADLVAIYEVNLIWVRALKELEPEYQLSALDSRGDDFGIALLSRGVEHSARVQFIGSAEVPSIVVESCDRRFPGILIFTHPVPPTSRAGALLRDGQLRALAELAQNAGHGRVVVAGDLNASPWSSAMEPLWAAGLRDLRKGFGISPTWMRELPWIAIPVDHMLGGSEVEVHSLEVWPEEGSDHTALLGHISARR